MIYRVLVDVQYLYLVLMLLGFSSCGSVWWIRPDLTGRRGEWADLEAWSL